jgi:hypothetical protein
MRSRLVAGLRTRPGSFALALSALLLIAAGFAVDSWMLTIPSHVRAACTDSSSNITYITADGTYCEGPNPLIQPWLGVVIAALGVGVLVMAWTVDRRPFERPRQGFRAFRAWGAPLLWLALVPIIAVPLASFLFDSEVREPTCQITPGFIFGYTAECPVSALVPSVLIPGLLNLVPLRWLWTANPRTRIAAVVASALGAAGLVGGLWDLFAQGPMVEVNSSFFLPALPPQGPYGFALGMDIWLLTLISLLVIAKLPLGMADFKRVTRTPAG